MEVLGCIGGLVQAPHWLLHGGSLAIRDSGIVIRGAHQVMSCVLFSSRCARLEASRLGSCLVVLRCTVGSR